MRIWLIKEGEPLPCDGDGQRFFRMGLIAQKLSDAGHDVLWWSSTFNHAKKIFRYKEDKCIQVGSNYRLFLIHSIAYKRNMSISRVIHHKHTSMKFLRLSKDMEKPDIILCSMPTIELCSVAVKYANENKIPVVLDIRDLWPDIYVDYAPKFLKPFVSQIIKFSKNTLSKTLKNATAIFALTPDYLNWGLNYAKRKANGFDKVVYMSYKPAVWVGEEIEKGVDFWRGKGITDNSFNLCFFGQFGHAADIETVIEAARLTKDNKEIKYIICGTGEKMADYLEMGKGLDNIVFPGWVGSIEIYTLMKVCKLGIIPYRPSKNYEMNVPNKFAEYMSAGLPVMLSVKGIMKELVDKNNCGFYYKDARDFGDIVLRLQANGEELQIMRENCFGLYKSMFNADNVYDDMMDSLKKMI